MADRYPAESAPFSVQSCNSAFSVLDGPGEAAVTAGVDVLTRLREDLRFAVDALKGAGSTLLAVHEGSAARATHRHLRTLEDSAVAGVDEAQRAIDALHDHGEYVRTVRADVRAIQEATPPLPQDPDPAAQAAYQSAADEAIARSDEAGERFRGNANHNFGAQMPAFDPAATRPADATHRTVSAQGVNGQGGVPAVDAIGPAGATPGAGGVTSAPSATATPSGATATPVPHVPPTGGDPSIVTPSARRPPSAGPVPAVPVTPDRSLPRSQDLPPTPTGPLTGWQPGTPWTARPSSPGGPGDPQLRTPPPAAPGPGQRGAAPSAPPTRPVTSQAPTPVAGRGAGPGQLPFLPGGAGAGRDGEHTRPTWLVEDDPDAIWFAGMPHHVDPVIGGGRPDPARRPADL